MVTNLLRVRSAVVFLSLLLGGTAVAQQASINGNVINLPVVTLGAQAFQVELTVVADTNPVELLVTGGDELTNFSTEGASSFDGFTLTVPSIDVNGISYWAKFSVLSEDPPAFVFVDAGPIEAQPPQSCTRPESDPSHGTDNPALIAGFSVPPDQIEESLNPDEIASIDNPVFTHNLLSQTIAGNTLVIGVKIGDDIRAYTHTVMDWHEIVNDQFLIDGQLEPVTINYCPLTGSAMLWKGKMESSDPTFGTSGKLYNSNLVLYDRETSSFWSQMLEQGINSTERLTIPDRLQVVETTWFTWKEMYPETSVMTTQTGFRAPYGLYPYGSFKTDNSLLFNVNNTGDSRLHRKERVVGVNVGNSSKVYPISSFGSDVTVLNDSVGDMNVVATGSSSKNFGVIFNRQLEDCTVLDFSAVQGQLPVMMSDNEGNQWDIFGTAVSGPRVGTQLEKTNSYIAYWYAWTAFFPNAAIYR